MKSIVNVLVVGVLVFVGVLASNDNVSLPIRLSVQKSNQCSMGPPAYSYTQNIESTLKRILDERYGRPCPCGHLGSWKRVIYLNMTDTTQECPSNWSLYTNNAVRGCGRITSATCDSAVFPTEGYTYNRVCGKLIAIQKGANDAFFSYFMSRANDIEGHYIDGLSLTHGAPMSRLHIWSFVAALYENDPNYATVKNCACTNTNYTWAHQVPSFVGDNYFCDNANPGPGWSDTHVYTEDPLWDGKGCGPSNVCCQFNQPPWFCTSLPQTTTDDLELRICSDELERYENVIVTFAEIYVGLQ